MSRDLKEVGQVAMERRAFQPQGKSRGLEVRPLQLERNEISQRIEDAVRVTRVNVCDGEGHCSGFGFCSQW